jgi:hypothetical protein
MHLEARAKKSLCGWEKILNLIFCSILQYFVMCSRFCLQKIHYFAVFLGRFAIFCSILMYFEVFFNLLYHVLLVHYLVLSKFIIEIQISQFQSTPKASQTGIFLLKCFMITSSWNTKKKLAARFSPFLLSTLFNFHAISSLFIYLFVCFKTKNSLYKLFIFASKVELPYILRKLQFLII